MIDRKAVRRIDIDPVWLMRIFTVIPVLVIFLLGAGSLWIYFFILSLLPTAQSTVDIPQLKSDVSVVRDRNGVPGILGENEDDLALVLGYVMAQDRLWQMDYLRRASQGKLAEILGSEYLDGDHLTRTLLAGTKEPAVHDERQQRWIRNFVKGVNRYISGHSAKLPVEFSLLEYRPEPFKEQDVLGIFQAMALDSSAAFRVDPVLARILGKLGKKRAFELFPTDPAATHRLVTFGLEGWEPQGLLFSRQMGRGKLNRVPGLRGGCGWAIDGTRTRSGKPMSGCSVYQLLEAPGFWYWARLVAPDFALAGAFVPGLPVAIAGNNSSIGWGAYLAPVDDADLYLESLDSDAPTRYWSVDRWRGLETILHRYRVKGRSSVSKTVMLTERGPLVSEPSKGRALSLRWTGRNGLGVLPAFFALNRARNVDDVKAALKSLSAPCMYIAWADEANNYGVRLAGRVPVRPPDSDGIVPMPGWTAVHDWRGFIPFDDLPSLLNPGSGMAVVADGRPGGEDYSFFTGCYWSDAGRHSRLEQLLGQSQEHYRETFQKIQGDTMSPLARGLTPTILESVGDDKQLNMFEKQAINLLSAWDFRMNKDSPAAAVFGLFYQALVEELFLEPLGEELFRGYVQYHPITSGMVRKIFIDGRKDWLKGGEPKEVVRRSFAKAINRGRDRLGEDLKAWKWGSIHTTVFNHRVTARSKFLELLYHVGPLGMAGAGDTVDMADWSAVYPFHVLKGVSLRHTSDMTQPPQVFGMTSMGVSAHFFSRHYKDQTTPWLKGRTFQDPILSADIRKNGFDRVLFRAVHPKRVTKR
ncbi:penicillin acylase family protein [Thermodesulfobacteriota bacterium]